MRVARYDGLADWYEHEFMQRPGAGTDTRDLALKLLGAGSGRLLDVGCGTGAYDEAFADHGWAVTGVDISEDMLRIARDRGLDVVRADAEALPFDSAMFDAAVSLWTHTDVDNFGLVLREIARVLRPDARFVYVGAHPCFVGPHSRFIAAEGVPTLYTGYSRTVRYGADAPGANPEGLRARVGAIHLPLGDFMRAFLDAGFRLEEFVEPLRGDYPYMLGLRWRSA